jgi:pyruvate/2-oxoglutarate/acetoin dehydrogenase E1 component
VGNSWDLMEADGRLRCVLPVPAPVDKANLWAWTVSSARDGEPPINEMVFFFFDMHAEGRHSSHAARMHHRGALGKVCGCCLTLSAFEAWTLEALRLVRC